MALAIKAYWEAQKRYLNHCQKPGVKPKPIRINEFNDETFKPYGRSLALDDEAVFGDVLSHERFYTGGRISVAKEGQWVLGRLVTDTRQGGLFYAVQCHLFLYTVGFQAFL